MVVSMSELCAGPLERARKAHATILQRLQEPGRGVSLATTLGVSESTISRLKNDQLENVLAFIHALGFRLVEHGKTCVDAGEIQMLRKTYARAVQDDLVAARLFGSEE